MDQVLGMSFHRHIIPLVGCLFSTVLFVNGLAAQQSDQDPHSEINAIDIGRLLRQLESDSYLQRNAASRQLADAGVAAVQQIVERLMNGPPESAARCSKLLSQIALEAGEQDMTRIARILLLISQNGSEHLRHESLILNSRWKQARIERTVKRLADAGIQATPMNHVGGGGRLGVVRAVDSIAINNLSGQPEQQAGNEATKADSRPPRLETDEILARVEGIIAATEEQNNKSFAEEILSQTKSPATGNPQARSGLGTDIAILGGEARVVVLGAGGVVTIDGRTIGSHGVSSPFYVTIDKNFSGSQEDLNLLKLLPAIAQVSITERKIDDALLEVLRTTESIQYLTLTNCDYDLAQMFAFLKKRPGLTVSASGHNSFLGVQLQTDQTSDESSICRVLEVVADTAAEEAGVKANDIVRKINDVPVATYEQVILAIGAFKPGDVLKLNILRDESEELEIEATLRDRPADQ